jgi:hypothetical protein
VIIVREDSKVVMRGMADVRVQVRILESHTGQRESGSAKLGAGDGGNVIVRVREYVQRHGCLGRRLPRVVWMAGVMECGVAG